MIGPRPTCTVVQETTGATVVLPIGPPSSWPLDPAIGLAVLPPLAVVGGALQIAAASLPTGLSWGLPGGWWLNGGALSYIQATTAGLAQILLTYPAADPGDGSPWWDGALLVHGAAAAPIAAPTPLTLLLLGLPVADRFDGTPWWNGGVLALSAGGKPAAPPAVVALLLAFPATDPGDGTPYWDGGLFAKGNPL